MKMITIQKTTQEIPLEDGLGMCLKVLERPKGLSRNEFKKQIRKDLISGKKVFKIRELKLSERLDCGA